MVGAVAYENGFFSLDLVLWYGLLAMIYAGQVGLAFMLRERAIPRLNTRTALALFTAIGLVEGIVWSIGIVGVSARRSIDQELTVLLIGAGVAAGAALSFGFHMPTFLCRFLGATVPYVLWAILRGDGLDLILALTVFVYSISSIQMTLGFNRAPMFVMPRGLILVIDDDPVIQSAMRSLLSSWGHDVIVAGSSAEMLDRIATRSRRPDLIICDYRLRDAENGIGVIKRLQSNYNERVPAVLITGVLPRIASRRRRRAVWSCCTNPSRRSSSGRRSATLCAPTPREALGARSALLVSIL